MKIEILADDADSQPNPDQRWAEELEGVLPPVPIQPLQPSYDLIRYANAGLWQGALAGCTSLLFNVIGSVFWPAVSGHAQHPLRLIQVFLTFPLGETALDLNSGLLLMIGSLMYLATGMVYGMVFVLAISYFLPNAGVAGRLATCSLLAVAVWLVNFYGILSWLQPLVFGGRWILELVPWWVAALTHLVFGWTIAIIYPLWTQPTANTPSDQRLD